MNDNSNPLPILWIASSKRDFLEMPEDAEAMYKEWKKKGGKNG